jgi:hemerythrin-like domain-containing protein
MTCATPKLWGALNNEDAQEEITEYIEVFFNQIRRHSRLNDEAIAVFAK